MTTRTGEVMWVLDHLYDVEADFRAFYWMDPTDILNLSGPRFLAMAYRLPAFPGVLAARMSAEVPMQPSAPGGATMVDGSAVALRADPALSSMIDF